MEAFTPFIPGDADASGFPAAVIRYFVTNVTAEPLDVSVVGSLANATGFVGYDVFGNLKLAGQVNNQPRDGEGIQGLHYATSLPRTTSALAPWLSRRTGGTW